MQQQQLKEPTVINIYGHPTINIQGEATIANAGEYKEVTQQPHQKDQKWFKGQTVDKQERVDLIENQPWQAQSVQEGSGVNPVQMQHISTMTQLCGYSPEELRSNFYAAKQQDKENPSVAARERFQNQINQLSNQQAQLEAQKQDLQRVLSKLNLSSQEFPKYTNFLKPTTQYTPLKVNGPGTSQQKRHFEFNWTNNYPKPDEVDWLFKQPENQRPKLFSDPIRSNPFNSSANPNFQAQGQAQFSEGPGSQQSGHSPGIFSQAQQKDYPGPQKSNQFSNPLPQAPLLNISNNEQSSLNQPQPSAAPSDPKFGVSLSQPQSSQTQNQPKWEPTLPRNANFQSQPQKNEYRPQVESQPPRDSSSAVNNQPNQVQSQPQQSGGLPATVASTSAWPSAVPEASQRGLGTSSSQPQQSITTSQPQHNQLGYDPLRVSEPPQANVLSSQIQQGQFQSQNPTSWSTRKAQQGSSSKPSSGFGSFSNQPWTNQSTIQPQQGANSKASQFGFGSFSGQPQLCQPTGPSWNGFGYGSFERAKRLQPNLFPIKPQQSQAPNQSQPTNQPLSGSSSKASKFGYGSFCGHPTLEQSSSRPQPSFDSFRDTKPPGLFQANTPQGTQVGVSDQQQQGTCTSQQQQRGISNRPQNNLHQNWNQQQNLSAPQQQGIAQDLSQQNQADLNTQPQSNENQKPPQEQGSSNDEGLNQLQGRNTSQGNQNQQQRISQKQEDQTSKLHAQSQPNSVLIKKEDAQDELPNPFSKIQAPKPVDKDLEKSRMFTSANSSKEQPRTEYSNETGDQHAYQQITNQFQSLSLDSKGDRCTDSPKPYKGQNGSRDLPYLNRSRPWNSQNQGSMDETRQEHDFVQLLFQQKPQISSQLGNGQSTNMQPRLNPIAGLKGSQDQAPNDALARLSAIKTSQQQLLQIDNINMAFQQQGGVSFDSFQHGELQQRKQFMEEAKKDSSYIQHTKQSTTQDDSPRIHHTGQVIGCKQCTQSQDGPTTNGNSAVDGRDGNILGPSGEHADIQRVESLRNIQGQSSDQSLYYITDCSGISDVLNSKSDLKIDHQNEVPRNANGGQNRAFPVVEACDKDSETSFKSANDNDTSNDASVYSSQDKTWTGQDWQKIDYQNSIEQNGGIGSSSQQYESVLRSSTQQFQQQQQRQSRSIWQNLRPKTSQEDVGMASNSRSSIPSLQSEDTKQGSKQYLLSNQK